MPNALLEAAAAGVPVVGVAQDVSDYFEWHHTAGDTVDKIRPLELAQAQAAFAALAQAAADAPDKLPPSPKPSRWSAIHRDSPPFLSTMNPCAFWS
jgi:ABC-type Fe3+-hydroxamate transport system substrate-binding protein